MSEWQLIETAPKDGSRILVIGDYLDPTVTFPEWTKMGFPEVSYWYDGKWNGPNAGAHDEYIRFWPTHWMPLPPLPSSQTGDSSE